jgi:nucleoside-diphosphate-sugar epimerase
MKKKILVVGGAGYIGGALTDQLSHSQMEMDIYDSLVYEDLYLKKTNLIYGDIRDYEKLGKIINNYDTVIWLAALVGDGACAVDPKETISINQEPIKWLCDNFKGRIIFTSTCSVYGANRERNLTEESPTNPLSVYAATKLEAERILLERGNCVIYRLGTVHGLGDRFSRPRLDLVVNILTLKAVRGEKLTVFGGSQWRPIIHVRDVAQILYMTNIDTTCWRELDGIYNIAEKNVEIKELALAVQNVMGNVDVEYIDMKYEDLRDYHVSNEKFVNATDWNTQISLEDSIAELAELYGSNRIRDPLASVYHNARYIGEKNDINA